MVCTVKAIMDNLNSQDANIDKERKKQGPVFLPGQLNPTFSLFNADRPYSYLDNLYKPSKPTHQIKAFW
jgi:hypothetical protein